MSNYWTVHTGKYHGKTGYENISACFLCYCGNQIGSAMPLYVAKAAAEKLNELGTIPEELKNVD